MSQYIKEIHIQNFKKFENISLKLKPDYNILVGDNEAGKSTVLEAINLALTGLLNGKYLKNELSQHIFNKKVVKEWLESICSGAPKPLPEIIIELYFSDDVDPMLLGKNNARRENAKGVVFRIAFDERYRADYEMLISSRNVKTLPIEYYEVSCLSFANEAITPKNIPIKPALIDSAGAKFQNGSDIYVSRIVKDLLETPELVKVIQAFRGAREAFGTNSVISEINTKIQEASNISNKNVKIDIDFPSKNAWEMAVVTYLDDIPFHFIGKGEQCMVKTKLALGHKQAQNASILLLEEPESHLSYTRLSGLIKDIINKNNNPEDTKQIIIATHSSFVANKLGLDNIIVMNDNNGFPLADLSDGTKRFFKKLAGYDTLRLILCKKTILVEGPSDELIVQRAYRDSHAGKLPIEDGIDVISVGTSFLRFLEIAEKIRKPVSVMTDNDGDVGALEEKYAGFLGENAKDYIRICFEPNVASRLAGDANFNFNTLEPAILRANNREILNGVFGTDFDTDEKILHYMHAHKTECALAVFDYHANIEYPQYIKDTFA